MHLAQVGLQAGTFQHMNIGVLDAKRLFNVGKPGCELLGWWGISHDWQGLRAEDDRWFQTGHFDDPQ